MTWERQFIGEFAPGNPSARLLKRAGVHNSCVRASDCEMDGGCWTLRWDIRGEICRSCPTSELEACRLDESCPSGSDMYAEPLWRRGFEIRSACPRLLVPPWFDGWMGGATREFKSCRPAG